MKIIEITSPLFELTRPEFKSDVGELLYAAGYEPLGSGVFGAVYGRPDKPFVLKVFDPGDGYLYFLRLIMSVSNPHFPVVKGKPVQINDNYWAVQLERLEPLEHNTYNMDVAGAAKRYVYMFYDVKDSEESRYYFRDRASMQMMNRDDLTRASYRREMLNFEQHFPEFAEALRMVYYKVLLPNDTPGDLHPGNFMQRGTTIVITDPLAYADRIGLPREFPAARSAQLQRELPLVGDLGYQPDWRTQGWRLPAGVRTYDSGDRRLTTPQLSDGM